jgi:hypothetical protein
MQRLVIYSILFILLTSFKTVAPKPNVCNLYGSIYVEENQAFADYKVYLEKSAAFADLQVCQVTARAFANKPGLWYNEPTRAFAKIKIAFVDSRAFADFSIAYTDSPAFAGCKK